MKKNKYLKEKPYPKPKQNWKKEHQEWAMEKYIHTKKYQVELNRGHRLSQSLEGPDMSQTF